MKNSKSFLLGIIILVASCKPEHIKINEHLDGTWNLQKLEYVDGMEKKVSVANSTTTITFINTRELKGIQKGNAKNYDFRYNFGYETYDNGYADCNLDILERNSLPIDAIGRVQVYWYKFINKNTIEFYIDKEYDFSSKQIIKNVKYTFVKI